MSSKTVVQETSLANAPSGACEGSPFRPHVETLFGGDSAKEKPYRIVFFPDRFAAVELPTYRERCREFVKTLQRTDWFVDHVDLFQVFRVDLTADQFRFGGFLPENNRKLSYDANALSQFPLSGFPRFVYRVLVVNEPRFGALADIDAMTVGVTLCQLPNQHVSWFQLLLHELSHVLFHLKDEYSYDESEAQSGSASFYSTGKGSFIAPNLTDDPNIDRLKWKHLAHLSDWTPRKSKNHFCAVCAVQTEAIEPIGLFEGGNRCASGVFRPAQNCLMRNLNYRHCRVCIDAIHNTFRKHHHKPRLAVEQRALAFGNLVTDGSWEMTTAITNVGSGTLEQVTCRIVPSDTGGFACQLKGIENAGSLAEGEWALVSVLAGPFSKEGHQTATMQLLAGGIVTHQIPLCVSVCRPSV